MKRVPWSLAVRFLVRDWRSGELLVLMAALVVAVSAMSAVTFFTDRVRQAVAEEAGVSLAADLRISASSPLPETYYIEARKLGLRTARTINCLSVVRSDDSTTLADVRGVSADYPLRGKVLTAGKLAGAPQPAGGAPQAGEVWAEPGLLARLGAGVGDGLSIGKLRQRVTRALEFRPDEGWRLMQLAPTVLLNLSDLKSSGLLQPGSRVHYAALFAGDGAELAQFRQWLEPRLTAGQEVEDARYTRPEVQRSIDHAERFLLLAALVSVLLGGVAIAMAARRFVVRRLDTVALMKCLGARHRDVLRLAITQLAILVVAAGIVGNLIGLAAQPGLAHFLVGFFQSDLPAPSPRGALLGPVTAWVIAVGFALPPLLQLGKVPPARVLRHNLVPPSPRYWIVYGVATLMVLALLYFLFRDILLLGYLLAGAGLTMALLYGAARVLVLILQPIRGGVGVAWRYGIANVVRRGRESSVQVVAFGLGLMVLLLLIVVRSGLMSAWQATIPESAPNRFVINIQPDQRDQFRRVLANNGMAEPRFTPLVRARIIRVNDTPVAQLSGLNGSARQTFDDEVNVSWAAHLGPGNRVVAGRWWQPGHTRPQLSVAQDWLDRHGLKLGDTVTFRIGGERLTFTISSVREVQWESFRPNFFMVVSPGAIEQSAHTFITSFHVPPDRRGVTVDLMRAMPNISVINIDAVLGRVRSAITQASLAVQCVFLFTLAAGVIVLLAAVQATRDERLFESAVLRALGARRSTVFQGVAVEFVVLGLAAGLLGATGAGVIGRVLAVRLFDLSYVPGPGLWWVGLAAGALLVGITGTLAVRHVVRESPVRTLRRG